MKIAVIVQARMTSSRLPGKIMLPFGNMTILGHVLTRCKQIQSIDDICCAIPVGNAHDVIANEAEKYNCEVYRGSELNVLERYYEAAKYLKADVIMRITSDCPLINPEVCSQVLKIHINENSEYTCNNMPPSWPHGYDCEVFNMKQLEEAIQKSSMPEDFEHVTPWMRRTYKVNNLKNPEGNQYSTRITLDTLEDYEFIKKYHEESCKN